MRTACTALHCLHCTACTALPALHCAWRVRRWNWGEASIEATTLTFRVGGMRMSRAWPRRRLHTAATTTTRGRRRRAAATAAFPDLQGGRHAAAVGCGRA